jgi:RHS repeat-associated protein
MYGAYRYGFNGKENDNEVKGNGNQQDYGMRIYDPRLGRFLSVDPLAPEYPWYTPYQFAGNKPIWAIDLDGLEEFFVTMNCFAPYEKFGKNNAEYLNLYEVSYLGDGSDREFGGDGTSRTSGTVKLDFRSNGKPLLSVGTAKSIAYFKPIGDLKALPSFTYSTLSPSNIEFEGVDQGKSINNDGSQSIKSSFHIWGSNKASPGGSYVNIDNHMNISVSLDANKSSIQVTGFGKGDRFPSTEAFIQDAAGKKIMLGASGHKGPNENVGPFLWLFNDNKRSAFMFDFSISLDKDGNFQNIIFNKKIYSIADWNKQFNDLNPSDSSIRTNICEGSTATINTEFECPN